MTNQRIENRRISEKDRDLIISTVEALGEIDLMVVINRLSLGLRAYATIQDPDLRGNVVDVAEDMWNEELVLTLLTTVSEISAKNDGVLFFPDIDELTPEERLDIEAHRARSKATELKGDNLQAHRLNLEDMYKKACQVLPEDDHLSRRALLVTYKALDADLVADIKTTEYYKNYCHV